MQQIEDLSTEARHRRFDATSMLESHSSRRLDAELLDEFGLSPSCVDQLTAEFCERHDFDDLIDTVKGSLWGLLDQPAAADSPLAANDGTNPLRTTALQGAIALEQLHTILTREFQVRDQLEREILEVRQALVQSRAELAGTQVEERRVRYLATHDDLTDLPNRKHFLHHLAQALYVDTPACVGLAVLFVDLDRFKQVNDTLGHAAGDELLRIVATRLTRTVRLEDMVGRLGGDEFACILPGLATRDEAQRLAMKLRNAIQAPCKIGDELVGVGASIGIAMYPADGADADDLLLKADMAMYRAKGQNAGCAFYDDPTVVKIDLEI